MKELNQKQQDQLDAALEAHEARSQESFQMAVAMRKVVGNLTAWRKLKSNKKEQKILNGRAKILNLVL